MAKRKAPQQDLFGEQPARKSPGGNLYYDARRAVWTADQREINMSDEELRAYRLAQFDEVFGPDEAWK